MQNLSRFIARCERIQVSSQGQFEMAWEAARKPGLVALAKHLEKATVNISYCSCTVP